MEPMLEAKGLSKIFTDKGGFSRGRTIKAVQDVDLPACRMKPSALLENPDAKQNNPGKAFTQAH